MPTISIEQVNLQQIKAVLAHTADGKALQRVLSAQLREAAAPIVVNVRRAVMAAPSHAVHAQPIRQAIADAVKTRVSYTGRSTGVAIGVGRNMPRGFGMAGKRFNSSSFRHPTGRGGSGPWRDQTGAPGWFDNHTMSEEAAARARVLEAIAEWSDALAIEMK
jgi:hypothetical protein